MEKIKECEQRLMQVGLSKLEAAAYIYLLRSSPATGYRVAKAIGTSYSNAYRILENLEKEGYIQAQHGKNILYRSIPSDELLKMIARKFQHNMRLAAEAVHDLKPDKPDQALYQLKTVSQVYERCLAMLDQSRERVLIELFPEPLERLKDKLEETAARGSIVAARIHRPAEINGVRVILSPYGSENISVWDAQWLAVYVDGLQYLHAILLNGGQGVHYAVWSENLYLARAFFSYLTSDLHHYAFRATLHSATSVEEIRESYQRLQKEFPVGGDLGYQQLLSNFNKKNHDLS